MVEKIVIFQRTGHTDLLFLYFGFTEGVFPFKQQATATMEVASGDGERFAKVNFPGLPIEIIPSIMRNVT